MSRRSTYVIAAVVAAAAAVFAGFQFASGASPGTPNTQIHHLVVIFDENESFDHYFGTYPDATNPAGEPSFTGIAPIGGVDNYEAHPDQLINNVNKDHLGNQENPARIDRPNALTCDNDHSYADEQLAFDGGAMDKFPTHTGGIGSPCEQLVMDYFDGNTVTGLWNLAQNFELDDNFYGDTFGPSTVGAINLISGNTGGASGPGSSVIVNGTDIGDADAAGDDCGSGNMTMSGTNIGDLMGDSAHAGPGMTWGWFQGGFKPTSHSGATAVCGAAHTNIGGASVTDYSAHHEPFQYYASTANGHHLPPSTVGAIGTTDQANHQYDLSDFDAAVQSGNLPDVSFLKAASFEDAHPGYSDPLDEQHFIARTLDELEQSPDWAHTAVVITYDDSDGWYDADRILPPGNTSQSSADGYTSAGNCGDVVGSPPLNNEMDRCGPGPRLPFLVISPWVDPNVVSHTQLQQSSIIRFIEDNWNLPRLGNGSFDATAGDMMGLFDFGGSGNTPKVFLDPSTGEVVGSPPSGVTSAPPTTTTSVTPPPTPTPTPIPTPTPTTTKSTPTPPPTTSTKAKLSSASATRKGKKLTVTIRISGLSSSKGKITVSLKVTKSGKSVASGKGTAKSGKVIIKLTAHKTLTKGSYKFTITVTQGKSSTKLTKTVKVR